MSVEIAPGRRVIQQPPNFIEWLGQQQGRQYELHSKHVNPAFVKMLKTIGFDKGYVQGRGGLICGMRRGISIWILLTGWGVFALGRNHPKVKSDFCSRFWGRICRTLVRMDC